MNKMLELKICWLFQPNYLHNAQMIENAKIQIKKSGKNKK